MPKIVDEADNLTQRIQSEYDEAIKQLREEESNRNRITEQLDDITANIFRLQGAIYALDKLMQTDPGQTKQEE